MGSSQSSPPPPPPSPTFRAPWRQISWTNTPDLLYVKNFELQKKDVKHVRILLYGPVGAGKSSFIGSVKHILTGKPSGIILCNAAENDVTSFTKKYETFQIKKDGENIYPFVFNDLMGLEQGTGVKVEDIKKAIEGHVREGYTFNPVAELTSESPFYNPSPSPEDKAHVLVCVYSANAPSMNNNILQKMKEIREAASNLGIPQLAILTHVDAACPETSKDLKNVYKSKYIKKQIEEFSTKLGIPVNCILPVKNYSEKIQSDVPADTLIMNAVRLMIDFADEFIDYKM